MPRLKKKIQSVHKSCKEAKESIELEKFSLKDADLLELYFDQVDMSLSSINEILERNNYDTEI